MKHYTTLMGFGLTTDRYSQITR